MKKYLLPLGVLLLAMSSCTSVRKTSSSIDVATELTSTTTADLVVADKKIEFVYKPTGSVRRAGSRNITNAAVAEALKANGSADVLVAPQFEVTKRRNLFGLTKVKKVVVYGYPATYKNFTND